MLMVRRLILALALMAGIAPAFAQVPAPVPALPDSERRTSYSISGSLCNCAVGFALYGDATDYANWLEVSVNGVLLSQAGNWTISSPSGPLGPLARPITDAVLSFAVAQTGTVQIVGARRPRRVSQYNESVGVPTRNFNRDLTDIIATLREMWDKNNDVTGRSVLAPAGETLALLPVKASRLSQGACFDSNGNLVPCVSIPGSTFAAGANITFTGTNPTTISTASPPTYAAGANIIFTGSNPTTISATPGTALNPQAGNYTIQTSDCGKIVQETGGPWTVALPAVTGFAAGCSVTVNNGNALRAHRMSGFPSYTPTFLYGGQSETVTVLNGAWVVTSAPGRFKITTATTIYVNASTGSDTLNDGLALGSPKATVQAAFYTVTNDFDYFTGISSIPLVTVLQGANDTTGVHFGPQGLSGAAAGGSITWDGGGFSVANSGDTDDAVHLFFGTALYIQNLTITAGPNNHSGLTLEHGATAFIKSGVVFTGTTQNTNHMTVRDGSSIEIDTSYSISGPASFHALCNNGGTIRAAGASTATVTTNITVNTMIVATGGGVCDFSNVTFSIGAFTVTGTRFQATGNGSILSKSGTPQTSIPGTVNGTATNGGGADSVVTVTGAQLSVGQLTNSLGGDVLMNNISNYFDGPSVAQGTSGTWFASGAVSFLDTAGAANITCKLWDGTTIIASGAFLTGGASFSAQVALSGYLASPAGNIRISCKDPASTNGKILFNVSGNSKDSTISTFRIN